jgi:hypothetical protein
MRHGFKAEAERIALEAREELGLDSHSPLDPFDLAALHGIPVYRISELEDFGASEAALGHYRGERARVFSAAVVPVGTGRLVLINDEHAIQRQHSNLGHELGHVLLEHQFPLTVLGADGCRSLDREVEEQAAWLSGELLVPKQAAFLLARRGATDVEVARRFQVSVPLAAWRMNQSGARKFAQRITARSR